MPPRVLAVMALTLTCGLIAGTLLLSVLDQLGGSTSEIDVVFVLPAAIYVAAGVGAQGYHRGRDLPAPRRVRATSALFLTLISVTTALIADPWVHWVRGLGFTVAEAACASALFAWLYFGRSGDQPREQPHPSV